MKSICFMIFLIMVCLSPAGQARAGRVDEGITATYSWASGLTFDGGDSEYLACNYNSKETYAADPQGDVDVQAAGEPLDSSEQRGERTMEKATFGAGCFWGVEAAFRRVPGVATTRVGYMGGALENPSYEDVCTDQTGHAEVVEVEFDPSTVSYDQLLDVFWRIHDPTTLNRQGPDVGTQYRSAIFYHTPEQKAAAEASRERLQGQHDGRIVTEITPALEFYQAEEYHQRYLEKRGRSSCIIR